MKLSVYFRALIGHQNISESLPFAYRGKKKCEWHNYKDDLSVDGEHGGHVKLDTDGKTGTQKEQRYEMRRGQEVSGFEREREFKVTCRPPYKDFHLHSVQQDVLSVTTKCADFFQLKDRRFPFSKRTYNLQKANKKPVCPCVKSLENHFLSMSIKEQHAALEVTAKRLIKQGRCERAPL